MCMCVFTNLGYTGAMGLSGYIEGVCVCVHSCSFVWLPYFISPFHKHRPFPEPDEAWITGLRININFCVCEA